jgi:hypothetical protein
MLLSQAGPLPDDLALKFAEKFWMPESFLRLLDGLMVVREDDGTQPGEEFLHDVDRKAVE